ncbi:HEAT repeat domain-containing protein [Lysobacter humi (ex Lee et al. 2017)]
MFTTSVRAVVGASLLVLAACAPSGYAVRQPVPSSMRYVAPSSDAGSLALQYPKTGAVPFMSGRLASTLLLAGAPLEPGAFLVKSLQDELAARGLPVTVADRADTLPRLDVRSFRMQNHRVSGYSPYVTFTFLSADLHTAQGAKRLGVFVKRGKVPVWSFEEVVEPTLNEPLSVAVKELASKVAHELYGARASDADVDALAAKVTTTKTDDYLDVYALGFSNNARAIPTLVQLTKAEPEYMRLAAISSLGTLRATDQVDLLRSLYRDANLWQDRAMALKAIGDLDTADGRAFLAAERTRLQPQAGDRETGWLLELIGLYV